MTNNTTKKISSVKKIPKRKKVSATIQKSKQAKRDVKSVSYQDYLIESLKDPKEAAGYLNAALSGGDIRVFLLALQNVIHAQGGIAKLSERTRKSRTSLYKSLSERGNPHLKSANELLTAMGMHFMVVPNKASPPMRRRAV